MVSIEQVERQFRPQQLQILLTPSQLVAQKRSDTKLVVARAHEIRHHTDRGTNDPRHFSFRAEHEVLSTRLRAAQQHQ